MIQAEDPKWGPYKSVDRPLAWLAWVPERKPALMLMLSALLSLVLTALVWFGAPYLRLPLWLPVTWAGITFSMGLLCWTLEECRRLQPYFNVVAFVLAYLAVIAFAFLNSMTLLPLALLVMAQVLVSLSFGHWVEYVLFAVVSLTVFAFCILSLPSMAVSPLNFLGLMGAATLAGGIYTWWGSGRLNPETPADLLISQLMDQDVHALFLLDDSAQVITFQNYAAAHLWNQIGLTEKDGVNDLLAHLGLSPTYLRERMNPSMPGKPERRYAQVGVSGDRTLRLEVSLSKLALPEFPYYLLRIQDITERVVREQNIQHSLSLNASLVQSIPDLMLTIDAENRIMSLHVPALTKERDRLQAFAHRHLGDLIKAFVPLKERAHLHELIHQARRTQHIVRAELVIPWGKQHMILELRIKQITRGGELLGMLRNITAAKQAQEALSNSESKYRTLVENMNEGLVMTDGGEEIVFVNRRTAEIFQMDEEELLGLSTFELIPEEENHTLLREKQNLRLRGLADEYELQFTRRDGQRIWLWIAGSPYSNANGRTVGTIAIITDITHRKQTEHKLQEKNNELDAFVYKASHDLRGPLTSIIGVTNLAKMEVKDEQAQEFFHMINQSTERLDLILGELLDATRINKAPIEPEPIEIHRLTQEIFQSLQHLDTSKSIDLRVDIALPRLYYDLNLLRSLIQNLVVNAILYHDPTSSSPWVKVSAERQDDCLCLSIADNGRGIPEKVQPRIFEMFFRGSTDSKGSGLGLYIVKKSVDKLGGNISFESEEGVGTTFRVNIPWREASERESEQGA